MKKIILLLLVYFPLLSQDYKIPPDVIRSLIEADPQPTINLTKEGDLGLILNNLVQFINIRCIFSSKYFLT